MPDFPTKYEHQAVEKKLPNLWDDQQVYKWDPKIAREENYVIDTPPPTVSGQLHMGHIFSYTQTDFIARFQRMRGKNVFYPMGFDNNGLPTERLVEKTKKVKASQLPRSEFIELCQEVVESSVIEFKNLFTSIGLSVDWHQQYQTIDAETRRISQSSFLDLFSKNRIYRQEQPSLWDIVDQTALAQAEIEDKEQESNMDYIAFSSEKGQDLIIATTRPEYIPACVAIFYNPQDKRYQNLKGAYAFSPLFKVKVPIIGDEAVDIEKGTGLVMCSTFGDVTDLGWWRKYNLPIRQIINRYGKIEVIKLFEKGNISTEYTVCVPYLQEIENLKILEAREKIRKSLQENGLLIKSEAIKRFVKHAERSGATVEIITTSQWFIKILDKKERYKAIANECVWYPSFMKSRIDDWIDGLHWDWCISRQRFFGIPFPVWYSKRKGEEGKILIADKEDLPVDPFKDLPKGYSREEVIADSDVMDTWATSALTPQIAAGGINNIESKDQLGFDNLFPADLRPQAHEIIRTWAFYTIVKAEAHNDSKPWKNLALSGWCLASDRTKMSKSKGNILNPVEIIKEKGADAVRYWASTSKLGMDTAFSEYCVKIGKKLITKLWNASNFCSLHIQNLDRQSQESLSLFKEKIIFETMDKWLISELYITIEKVTEEFEKYNYSIARLYTEEFFWNKFCDNYLEIVKGRIYDPNNLNPRGKLSAIWTIYFVLETIVKLFAPYIPFVTEEIFQLLFTENNISVHSKNNWPKLESFFYDEGSCKIGTIFLQILEQVRKFKTKENLSMKAPLKMVILYTSFSPNLFETIKSDLINVLCTEEILIKYKEDYELLVNIELN